MKTAFYPGSFDPFTIAHEQIVRKALTIFDKVVIGIGYNIDKKYFLSVEDRRNIIERIFSDNKNVEVIVYGSLTIDVCKEMNIKHIIRGVRNFADFEFEKNISDINSMLSPDIDTIYLTTEQKYSAISSSAVRELIMFDADVSDFLSEGINIDRNGFKK